VSSGCDLLIAVIRSQWLFEAHGLEPWLVKAKDVKHLPVRPKTDRLDAVRLCKVAERRSIGHR
jgi:transposase